MSVDLEKETKIDREINIANDLSYFLSEASQVVLVVKELTFQCWRERQVQALGQEDSLEEGMVTHSSILAQRLPWTEGPGWHSP